MWVSCPEGHFAFTLWVTPRAAYGDLAHFSVGSGCEGSPLAAASPQCLRDGITLAEEVPGAAGEAICAEVSSARG